MLRPLGCAELFFHLYAQVYPVHFCLCAEIEGTVDAAALRPALDQVRERHPCMRALQVKRFVQGIFFPCSEFLGST
jgi:hypothetical protein